MASFTFAACSGATTADVANSQLGGRFSESYHPTADGHSQAYEPTFAAAAG